LTDCIALNSAVRELNIRENNVVENIELCKDAAVGNPVAGGAYGRRTPWVAAIPFLKGGHRLARRWWFTHGDQGNKRHLGFSFLQSLLEPKDSFPHTVMFQLIQVNDTVILPIPFEVTTESGRRMADRVKREFVQAGDDTIQHVWVASNANGYFGYATTPEEYSHQGYEGGHTLYGPYTTPYLTAQLGLLTHDFKARGEIQELLPDWRYLLRVNTFYPEAQASTGQRRILVQPALVQADEKYEEDYIVFRWQDVGPSAINFHLPLCRMEAKCDNQWVLLRVNEEPIHDDGYDLEVRYVDKRENGMGEYEVRWYNPAPGGEYRFWIAPRQKHSALTSRSFTYKALADGQGKNTDRMPARVE
jgi:neutral ceramidase